MKWVALISILIVSCTSKNSIHKSNGLEVIFYNNGDTLKQASTNDTLIKHFGDVLNGNAESLPACKIIGRVDFYRNDELVETVDITETDKECSHLVVGKNAWRMTYNVGMYLSWLYDDLIKKNE